MTLSAIPINDYLKSSLKEELDFVKLKINTKNFTHSFKNKLL